MDRKDEIADEETVQKIIAALKEESTKYETSFKLIIATGMRRGECCALKRKDFDFESHTHAFDNNKKVASQTLQSVLEI